MLGKLIKYEFKHTSKTMLTTYVVLAFATIMGSLALIRLDQGSTADGTFLSLLSMVMLVLYIIAIIGIYCIDFIYLCYHYNKTMYSSQGYLTHTLPVSPAATFSTKILVFFTWMLISSVLSVISVLILLQIGSGGEFFQAFADVSWSTVAQQVNELFGISAGFLIFLFLVESLLGILLYIMWITASMAIGQLFQKNRIAFSILAAFCLYIINQIISSLFLVASGYNTGLFLEGELRSFMNTVMGGSIFITIIFLVLLYGICIYINKKKLNLE